MRIATFALAAGLSVFPVISASQTFEETFECRFGRGIVNKPTPEFLVFSIDEYGRSAFIHDVTMPNIETQPGPAAIKRDSIRVLSISWVGPNYVFSDSGRSYAQNESRIDALDLLDQEFSVFLDRRTMKATARSSSYSAYLPRDGFARGTCQRVSTPSS